MPQTNYVLQLVNDVLGLEPSLLQLQLLYTFSMSRFNYRYYTFRMSRFNYSYYYTFRMNRNYNYYTILYVKRYFVNEIGV